ncbi:MAG: hypothetical protein R3A12_14390 [Ignavibacteria bacterium]
MFLDNYRNGMELVLDEKGSSYRQWYHALEEYGKSKRLLSQENLWKQFSDSCKPIKVDKEYSEQIQQKDFELKTVELDQTTFQLAVKG